MSMIERFRAKPDLVRTLLSQKIVQGNETVAKAIAEAGELVPFVPGERLIEQGASDRTLYFILCGRTQIIVNGARMHFREAGVTVGEMSAANASITRSATVEAASDIVVVRLSHDDLVSIGAEHPDVWRLLAEDLAGRVEQRNTYVDRANIKPRVFMMSSAENLRVAEAIRLGLSHDASVCLWSDPLTFQPSGYTIETFEREVATADFAIALCHPDDVVRSRGAEHPVARDNVVFEIGFFMARLGRHRTFVLVPHDGGVRLPSDFKGLTPVIYTTQNEHDDLSVALGPTVGTIKEAIHRQGVRSSLVALS